MIDFSKWQEIKVQDLRAGDVYGTNVKEIGCGTYYSVINTAEVTASNSGKTFVVITVFTTSPTSPNFYGFQDIMSKYDNINNQAVIKVHALSYLHNERVIRVYTASN